MRSPYSGLKVEKWRKRTEQLIANHPLSTQEIVEVTLRVWNDIFASKIGRKPFQIGKDIFPKPQIMAFLLHELIPLEFSERYKDIWKPEQNADDKDLVYIPDDSYSIEIKTSSSSGKIYGNRSYAQEAQLDKKSKSGYYLAINFEKFKSSKLPRITLIRFGWIDHEDWIGQKAATGQQARLDHNTEVFKLQKLYP